MFKATGFLIRIIVEVIVDMRSFLLILLVAFLAFGDAFYAIAMGQAYDTTPDADGRFIHSFPHAVTFSYEMVLGNFDTAYPPVSFYLSWALFLLCTVINMIVLMNLLIAIISESFARVNADAVPAGY
jgi:hypothetical protein